MKAAVGDRIVVASTKLEGPVRDGVVIELRHPDGSPPYRVQWSDGSEPALVFPGPDARVVHTAPGAASSTPTAKAAGSAGPRHVRSWQVRIDVFEDVDDTSAHAVLSTDAPTNLEGHGQAHRRPGDAVVPEIGDEIAVARALRRLSDVLLGTAAEDIGAIEGHPVVLSG